jgi:hypothetical protein
MSDPFIRRLQIYHFGVRKLCLRQKQTFWTPSNFGTLSLSLNRKLICYSTKPHGKAEGTITRDSGLHETQHVIIPASRELGARGNLNGKTESPCFE